MIAKVILLASLATLALAQYGRPPPSYGPGPAPAYGPGPSYGPKDDYPSQPIPYDFGYDTNDDYGTTTFRKESGDGHGRVQGSYGYKDLNGIERIVEYVADEHGYRAEIKTNEPGTDNQSPADVVLSANPIHVDPKPDSYGAPRPAYGGGGYSAPRPRYAPAPAYGRY